MRYLICIFIHLFASFFSSEVFAQLNLKPLEGKSFSFPDAPKSKGSVFIFLSPDCPLCISYTLTLNDFYNKYQSQGIAFYGIFPGTYHSKRAIKKFVKKYKLKLAVLPDPGFLLTKEMGAEVTPEVFVSDSAGAIIYSGKIDNWAYGTGKKRTVITEFYLQEVLDSIIEGKEITVKKTEPVGCYIFQQDGK